MSDINKINAGQVPKRGADITQYAAFASDSVTDPFADSAPPLLSNRIRDYRRIQNWENYFLCSAICSVGKKLGSDIDDFHFYANITGDNFTYLYAAEKGNPGKFFSSRRRHTR